jgi:hypothetical protein
VEAESTSTSTYIFKCAIVYLRDEPLKEKLMAEQHGYRGTPTYGSWICMRQRCNNPKSSDYHNYGGRGIQVCASWQASFKAFLQDMGERPEGHTLDRKDNEGMYCKDNCRWATHKTQIRNTRVNRWLTYKGETKCLAEWAEQYGLKQVTLKARLDKSKWSLEKALTTKEGATRKGHKPNQKLHTYKGDTKNLKEWAVVAGLKYATLHKRVTVYGMDIAEAIEKPLGRNAGK